MYGKVSNVDYMYLHWCYDAQDFFILVIEKKMVLVVGLPKKCYCIPLDFFLS